MNFSLIRGAAMILVPRFQVKSLLRTIHRKKPTAMPVVPTILTAINGFDRLARYDLTSLRYCISGGAPLPLEVKQQFEARSTCQVVEGYGLSESSPVLCCNPAAGGPPLDRRGSHPSSCRPAVADRAAQALRVPDIVAQDGDRQDRQEGPGGRTCRRFRPGPGEQSPMKNVVIAGYVRSPFHFASKGALARVRPDDLAAAVIRGLIERTGVPVSDLEDLIVGCAFPEVEQGLNVARLIGFLADLPLDVAGATVNRFCGSSMQAI